MKQKKQFLIKGLTTLCLILSTVPFKTFADDSRNSTRSAMFTTLTTTSFPLCYVGTQDCKIGKVLIIARPSALAFVAEDGQGVIEPQLQAALELLQEIEENKNASALELATQIIDLTNPEAIEIH